MKKDNGLFFCSSILGIMLLGSLLTACSGTGGSPPHDGIRTPPAASSVSEAEAGTTTAERTLPKETQPSDDEASPYTRAAKTTTAMPSTEWTRPYHPRGLITTAAIVQEETTPAATTTTTTTTAATTSGKDTATETGSSKTTSKVTTTTTTTTQPPKADDLRALVRRNLTNYTFDWSVWSTIQKDYFRSGSSVLKPFQLNSDAMKLFHDTDVEGALPLWLGLYTTILYSEPMCFHGLEDGIGISWYQSGGGEGPVVYPRGSSTQSEYSKNKDKFQAEWESQLSEMKSLTAGRDTLEAALLVAQHISFYVVYDDSYSKRSMRIGVEDHEIVCMGYTNWFNSIMYAMGYNVVAVTSDALNHVWSAIWVPEENRWAEIDVTWMDPTIYDGSDYRDLSYFDFCSRDSVNYEDHYCEDQYSIAQWCEVPAPLTFTPNVGFGYRYRFESLPVGSYPVKVEPLPGKGFTIYWSDGSQSNESL